MNAPVHFRLARLACLLPLLFWTAAPLLAQSAQAVVAGVVTDEAGGALPGVEVRVTQEPSEPRVVVTDASGHFSLDRVPSGPARLTFAMPNFGTLRRDVVVPEHGTLAVDAVLRFVLSADVTVTGRQSFTNLADASNPAENLVGIAQSASQGAITARQLETRPMSRAGEVLETVPGVIVSQHSGEGKANQYYLRGFNLDHGTDFATTVAGMPANMPTHGHGQGYTDLNFLIPELVSGVQYSKGPYFADQGDFATAGAANIAYAVRLPRSTVSVTTGGGAYVRALASGSHDRGGSSTLGALEVEGNNGPWIRPDAFRKLNGVARFSRGDALSGLTATAMAYDARWNATDQIPERAVTSGVVDRFGTLDATDGGSTARYSVSAEWQRSTVRALTKVSAFGIQQRLSLFSNFTYLLDDPSDGDQFQQSDRRTSIGARLTHRRLTPWRGRAVQHVTGIQVRTDGISLELNHTANRVLLANIRRDSVRQSSLAGYAETSVEWTTRLRTITGVRVDGEHAVVNAISNPANSGTVRAGLVSPKAGLIVGPFVGTEFYANAGAGFHSNDARGVTMRVDPRTGDPAEPATPLVRATGAEVGVRTVAVPRLQSTLSVWSLAMASELVFVGDAGTTEAGRPSHRRGVELANYYHPLPWIVLDADVSLSRARFTDTSPDGQAIPGAVQLVASGWVTVEHAQRVSGSVRLRYFGPRPLVEDDSVRSKATTLVNLQGGYRWSSRVRVAIDALNVLNAHDSDVDYYYVSRLPGEPAAGRADVHFHPALPRTFRLSVTLGL